MQKAIVIGCPGAGKSVFARALQAVTGLPLTHLDMLYWNADGTTVPKAVFRQRLAEVLCRSAWIIDGNYASTMPLRLQHCDTVFFLDYPSAVCIAGIRARRGKPRADMPCITPEDADEDFAAFVQSYETDSRPGVLALLAQHPEKTVHIFRSRTEADAFLTQLARSPAGNDVGDGAGIGR